MTDGERSSGGCKQVAPAIHEAQAYLYYAPVDHDGDQLVDYDGMDAYKALSSIVVDGLDGYREIEDVDINGERWNIRVNYSKSGFTPRPEHDIDNDRLWEFDITVNGRAERKIAFNFSPRHEDMLNSDGEPTTTAFDHTEPDEGVAVHCRPSNVRLDEIPALIPRFLAEIADAAGTSLYHGYFEMPFDGRVMTLERYVRLTREANENLISKGGVLDRLSMHLSDVEGTAGKLKWDNEEVKGHLHMLEHGSESAREMCAQHSLGGQIKSYLPQHPDAHEPEDPLHHPKLGVKFVKGRHDGGAIPWDDRQDVVDELDERLLSILAWADVDVEIGGTFVADDHFKARRRRNALPVHADPLPRLEAEQDHLLMTALGDLTPSDRDFIDTLAADGAQDAADLADSAGWSMSTLYRALQRVPEVIESDRGHVQFVTEKIRQDIQGIVETLEEGVTARADTVGRLLDMDVRQSASSAFDKWLASYAAEFVPPSRTGRSDGRPVVRIDTVLSELKSTAEPMIGDVLREMLEAWRNDGRDVTDLTDAIVEARVDGRRISGTVTAMA